MKWYVDFSGYCEIEADTIEKAEEKFWNTVQKPCIACENDVYDIDSIEPVEEKEED